MLFCISMGMGLAESLMSYNQAPCLFVEYSFHKPLIFFWLTQVDILCLSFGFSLHQRYAVRRYILQMNKQKKRHSFSPVSNPVSF